MSDRAEQLHSIGRSYVASLRAGDFESIPYAEAVELRAPLCPGGSATPLVGRNSLRDVWFAPLRGAVSGVEVLDSYVNDDLSGVAVEFLCRIDALSCTLRIMDRFSVNDAGEITSQENYFDPRDVTHPGWQQQ